MAGSSVPRVGAQPRRFDPSKGFHAAYALTIDDHIAIDFGGRPAGTYLPWFYFLAALIAFGSLFATHEFWRAQDWTRFFAINGIVLAILVLARWALRDWLTSAYRKALEKDLRERGHVGRHLEISAEPSGLTTVLMGSTMTTPWNSLTTIEEVDDGPIYFWLTPQEACIWPARLFETNSERLQFRQAIADWAGYRPVRPALLARLTSAERRELANGRLNIGGFVDRARNPRA